MRKLRIKTVEDAVCAATLIQETGDDNWWRGHADAKWPLVASVHRKRERIGYEQAIANVFKQRAPARYPKCPNDSELASWLFLMQHYRLPTRLLDWTQSILVALFFAVNELPRRAAAVWALNPFALTESQTGDRLIFLPKEAPASEIIAAAFGKGEFRDELILPMLPDEIDLRMVVQHSAFTIHSTSSPLEQKPKARSFLAKFEIPANAKPLLRYQLNLCGVRESALFPDLEHLAQDTASLGLYFQTAKRQRQRK